MNKAFTILEMSVVMAIIAVLISSGLTMVTSSLEKERVKITNERLAAVQSAITRYAQQFKLLPCPAGGDLAVSHAEFGRGMGTNTGTCTATDLISIAATAGGNIVIGTVPTAELGIEPIFMLDGWNRKITYVVDERLTLNSNYIGATVGNIIIQGEMAPPNISDKSAVAIISHGKNGHGAWRLKGTKTVSVATPGTVETSNIPLGPDNVAGGAAVDDTFQIKSFSSVIGPNYFDDIVIATEKWQFQKTP